MKRIKKGGLSRRLSVGLAGAKGGLGLLQSRATGMLLPRELKQDHNDRALSREASKFVAHLGELKGAYVKIGQMLALYGEHVLPGPVTEALHTLESATQPIDWPAIQAVLSDDLGRSAMNELDVCPNPIAAASLAQVHRCDALVEGVNACVKIQYPGIADTIEDDFSSVARMLGLARWVKSAKQLDVLLREVKQFLLKEVDYERELSTAETVSELLQGDVRYKVPMYFSSVSSRHVLTMEYIDAEEINSAAVQSLSLERRNKLAEAMLELFFKEAFEWRLMQTDPNFGNYRILIQEEGDRLVLLDFGAVHELGQKFCAGLQKTILAAQQQNTEKVIDSLIELECLNEADDEEVKLSFARFCEFILEPFRESFEGVPQSALCADRYDWHGSKLLRRAGKLGSQGMLIKGFAVPPPEFMLMVRKLTGVFTFASTLKAQTHSAELLDKYRRQ